MKDKNNIPLINIFFLINIFHGIYTFFNLAKLPASESERAVLFGFSLIRILMYLVCIAGIFTFMILFFSSLKRKSRINDFIFLRINKYFQRNDFPLAIILSFILLAFITGITLEILLNPTFFPRAKIYLFLYERIRPLFLWFVYLCGELAVLLWMIFWSENSTRFSSLKTSNNQKKILSFLSTLAAWILMVILWFVYTRNIDTFSSFLFVIPLLILILMLLNVPFILSIKKNKSKNHESK